MKTPCYSSAVSLRPGKRAEQLPRTYSSPSGPTSFQSDKIRKGDMDCQNAVGGGMNLELGVTGIINNATGPFDRIDPMYPERKDVGVYARIVIPLDGPKEPN